MAEVIVFPVPANHQMEQDPYYCFLFTVLSTADACGFSLPFSVESAARHVYQSTRDNSQLAKLLNS